MDRRLTAPRPEGRGFPLHRTQPMPQRDTGLTAHSLSRPLPYFRYTGPTSKGFPPIFFAGGLPLRSIQSATRLCSSAEPMLFIMLAL